ncbi:MAG: hypothetical protein JWQ79_3590, partial [Mucilaginibacter sp.]|nr:hypothetical protein [Mucilaginibacter sp.]
MAEQGTDIINRLKRKWIGYQLLADVVLAAACALFAITLLHGLLAVSLWWLLLLFILITG